jgi:hypothetical protein
MTPGWPNARSTSATFRPCMRTGHEQRRTYRNSQFLLHQGIRPKNSNEICHRAAGAADFISSRRRLCD